MGLTALDGRVMGTRCGAIDPGVLLYLQQAMKMSVSDVERLLYHESGLLGVSGISQDVRTLLANNDPKAAEALDLFAFRIAREVAAMANSLGGLESLVFTGGIGEHAGAVRSAVCERLHWLGVELDPEANELSKPQIGSRESRVDVRIDPTDEEITIARHCCAIALDIQHAVKQRGFFTSSSRAGKAARTARGYTRRASRRTLSGANGWPRDIEGFRPQVRLLDG